MVVFKRIERMAQECLGALGVPFSNTEDYEIEVDFPPNTKISRREGYTFYTLRGWVFSVKDSYGLLRVREDE